MPEPMPPAASAGGSYWTRTRNLATSYLFVLPALLLYVVGVNLAAGSGRGNAVAQWFEYLAELCGHVNILNALLLCGLFVSYVYLKQAQGTVPWRLFAPLQCESLLWGAALVVFALFFQARMPPALSAAGFDRALGLDLLVSVGAGVYEETLFRLIIVLGLVALVRWASRNQPGEDDLSPLIIGVVAGALLFSLAHHLVRTPEGALTLGPIELRVFVFRALCGLLFGALFVVRGYAVAVYAHVWYDVLVVLYNRFLTSGG